MLALVAALALSQAPTAEAWLERAEEPPPIDNPRAGALFFGVFATGVFLEVGLTQFAFEPKRDDVLWPGHVRAFGPAGGALMIGLAPNLGDLIAGDWPRFLLHGVTRAIVFELGILGVFLGGPLLIFTSVGFLAGFCWTIYEVTEISHLEQRWRERRGVF